MLSEQDSRYLRDTAALAERGRGAVSPNPMVGALVVRGNRVIAEGYHRAYGGPHAETHALDAAGAAARGAALYCNLEPCSYTAPEKHQPPCTRRIIESGVRRVIIGQVDPNPHVRGNGIDQLRRAGLEVELAEDSDDYWRLNDGFNTSMALRRPFVHGFLGLPMPAGSGGTGASLPGAVAGSGSGAECWDQLNNLLAGRDAAAVDLDAGADCRPGAGPGGASGAAEAALPHREPLQKSPQKTPPKTPYWELRAEAALEWLSRAAEAQGGKQLIVIFDRFLRTPPDSRLLRDHGDRVAVIAAGDAASDAAGEKKRRLEASGARVFSAPEGRPNALTLPGELEITSMLVLEAEAEAGGNGRIGFFDRITLPGDAEMLRGAGAEGMKQAWDMRAAKRHSAGDGCFVDAYHRQWLPRVRDFQGLYGEEMGREAC